MPTATPSDALDDLLDKYEWESMQAQELDTSGDNARIFRTAENTAHIVQLLICVNLFLAVIIGCLLASIFSRFLRS